MFYCDIKSSNACFCLQRNIGLDLVLNFRILKSSNHRILKSSNSGTLNFEPLNPETPSAIYFFPFFHICQLLKRFCQIEYRAGKTDASGLR